MARYGCSNLVARWLGQRFPWGTLLVNIVGSFVIGWCAALVADSGGRDPTLGLFVMVGICGGYTTFSAVSLQTLVLTQEGAGRQAAAYVVGSVLLCGLAVMLGLALGLSGAA
ncbi:MAG: CrcB family protein [Pseudomonadota bacterium]